MTKKIFNSIILVSIITMLASIVFIMGVEHQYYDDSQLSSLENQMFLISQSVEKDLKNINDYNNADIRITLINENGVVEYDNKADIKKLENHNGREEIKNARKNQNGTSVRYSKTLSKRTCYYAKLIKDNYVLRVSSENFSIFAIMLQLLTPICAVIIFAFVLSIILAIIISKKIVKPLNEIDLDKPDEYDTYDELSPFIIKIKQQNNKIKSQIESLTKSRQEFEVISENMNEGLLLTDINGDIVSYNHSIELFFDVSDNLTGKNILMLNRSESFRTIFENIINHMDSESLLDYNNRCYEIIGNPVNNDNNAPIGAVILVIDVTEKQDRERLRREFTANVSHELKTPLTSILGISDMLKSGIVAPSDISGFANDINKETVRLIALVNDIIKLSELDEGASNKNNKNNEECNLKTLALEVTNRLENIADKKGITLTVNGTDAIINAENSLIFEMIYNLCDNAIKYNKENGSVSINVGENENKKYISVQDNGIGISKEDCERIFERFYRVDKSRSKQSGGTGLGLSIVKHIAKTYDGKIEIKSELKKGTEIKISF